ncbi:hypothetical protein CYY_004051 [Polysphondylium violaceum]|uniref:Peptidase A1 domain-containing protein n=1 Tax=Polysphondylium violaceum TaxID=133409 RepID=A0A8J4UTA9_9MYCE|nr:hypothetical protein CYY_004051 [Polysphondylium violaceum]
MLRLSISKFIILFIILSQWASLTSAYTVKIDQDNSKKFLELPLIVTSRGQIDYIPISDNMVELKNTHLSRHTLGKELEESMIGNLYQINAKIQVGEQDFLVQVDTGSTLMAIPLTGCNLCNSKRPTYNPAASNHSQLIGCNDANCKGSGSSGPRCKINSQAHCDFILRYGDGSSVTGNVYADMVTISGVSAIAHFGANVHESAGFEYPRADGIIGFGRSCKSCVPTVYESMVAQQGLKNIFGMMLDYEGGGVLSLSDLNPNYYEGDIEYTPFDENSLYYKIQMTGFVVANHSIPVRDFGDVIVDSGSTALVLASRAYNTLIHILKKNFCHIEGVCGKPDIFSSRCYENDSVIDKFPVLHFGFKNGVRLAIPPKNYLIKSVFQGGKVGYCFMIDEGDDMTILGDVFMRGYYTIFDNESHRIGFAVGRNSTGSVMVGGGFDAEEVFEGVPMETSSAAGAPRGGLSLSGLLSPKAWASHSSTLLILLTTLSLILVC